MRKFLITSPNYEGTAALVYDADGLLVMIDLTEAKMNRSLTSSFKARVPAHVSEMEATFAESKAVVVETSYTVTFEMFWDAYGDKVNKKRCIPLWNKLSKTQQVQAYHGIKKYEKHLKKSGHYKLNPENYLRNETWENEYKY